MLPISAPRLVVVALAVLAIACGDPTKPKPTFLSTAASYTLYPLDGAPPNTPNAISFLGGATRASGSFQFDVALDLDASGKVLIFPVRLLGGTIAGTLKRVGLQAVPGTFDALREVPAKGTIRSPRRSSPRARCSPWSCRMRPPASSAWAGRSCTRSSWWTA